MADPLVEIRGEIAREHVDVIDAIVQANPGTSRMSLLREIIAQWCERKVHEATLVGRLVGGNGTASESHRNRTGKAPR